MSLDPRESQERREPGVSKKNDDVMPCKERVYDRHHSYQCGYAAITPKGYCGVHDPDRKAERAARRPPPAFERENLLRKQLDKFLKKRLTDPEIEVIRWAMWRCYGMQPTRWPLPDLEEMVKELAT